VLQGEREMSSGNKSLGQFNLEGIPPAPRGMPQIEVIFDIDANGIMHVTAKDKATGKENKITIKANSGLSEAEIQAMVKDAELHAEEDKKAHELADARNGADGMIHMVKKSLAEYGKELSDEEKAAIETAVKATEDAIRGNDIEDIKAKSEALSQAAQKLGEKMYAQQQAQAGAEGGAGMGAEPGAQQSKKDDGDVVDAEFTEVPKDKK
jgi:molecular chaperone DnaK